MQQHTYYSISRLNPPISSGDMSRYRTLRLEALSTDPSAFSTSYSREQAVTETQWRDRLEGDDKAILIASQVRDSNDPEGENTDSWVGMLRVLGPKALASINFTHPFFSFDRKEKRIHALMSMWIHPSHRRRGLATQLIRAAIEIAAGDALIMSVTKHNAEGLALYEKLGFVRSDIEIKDGNEIWLIKEAVMECIKNKVFLPWSCLI